MRCRAVATAVAMLGLLAAPVFGATSSIGLSFEAPESSLWGWGPSGMLQYHDSASLIGLEFSYDFGASTGTVSAGVNGSLTADHPDALAAPGNADIALSFLGVANGGFLNTNLGAWANLTAASIPLLDEDYALTIDHVFTPTLGAWTGAEDDIAVQVPAVDLFIAEAGAGFQIEQTSNLRLNQIEGLLNYGLRGSGTSSSLPFTLGPGGSLSPTVELDEAGVWDFWASDLRLGNSFFPDFDLGLFIYESHPEIHWGWKWGFIPYPIFTTATNMFEIADIDLFRIDPFALAFLNTDGNGDRLFSIQVADGTSPVPEPATMLLLGSGLAALAGYRRRG